MILELGTALWLALSKGVEEEKKKKQHEQPLKRDSKFFPIYSDRRQGVLAG